MKRDVIRILLVEDSASDADILQGSLRQTHAGNFEFSWVERLEDGLARLGRETYDALLLDLNLPDSSGPETFRRAQQAAPGLPVVVLTGSHDEAIGLAAVREGVQEYLIKGETDGRQIARAIRYAIERKQFQEQQRRSQERIRHQNAVLAGINRILSEALTCDSEEELGGACLMVAQEVTGSRFGFIGEINAEGQLDDIVIGDTGWEACRIGEGRRRKLGGFKVHGIYGRVLTDGKGFFTNDPEHHPDRIGLPDGHPPLDAFLGVPLKHDGKTMGMIAVANRVGGYRAQDLEALEALALGVVQVFMRKRAEQAVRASEERLRQGQKMESIGVLAGGVAHDFNNLLASVMGNASLLREEVSGEKLEKVESIIRASERAADLTRQLLAYAGKGRVVVAIHDFSHIVRDMTDLLRASIPKKVSLKLALADDLPGVEADRGQLQQIVMNLVLNGAEAIGADRPGTLTVGVGARQASATDRVSDEITGRPLAPGSYVWLEVADTGSGMDEATRTRIFDPFFTTKFLGRGLGLAAVAGIVQMHHGAIQLRTAPGQGATFRVYLPAGAAAERQPREARRAEARGTATVLLVDDEAMVRDFARAALEKFGYRVLTANDGQEAVRVFEANSEEIGLVLLDLTMPVLGGDEAIGLLKSKSAGLRVIVMSGYGKAEVLKAFAGKGVSGFLQKPFTATRLAEEVRAVLASPATASSAGPPLAVA
jgi:signal transduction histidine kinase/DNA-binding response OmpR family regulator